VADPQTHQNQIWCILTLRESIYWQQIWRFSLEATGQINIINNLHWQHCQLGPVRHSSEIKLVQQVSLSAHRPNRVMALKKSLQVTAYVVEKCLGELFLIYRLWWLHHCCTIRIVTGRRAIVHSLPGCHSAGSSSPPGSVCRQGDALTGRSLTDVHSRSAQRAASGFLVPRSLLSWLWDVQPLPGERGTAELSTNDWV